jgi:hypothetical protein
MNARSIAHLCRSAILLLAVLAASGRALAQSAPVVDAGIAGFVQLPATLGTLRGTATDPNNAALTTTWAFVSGPATPNIVSPSQLSTQVTGLATVGTYTFRLTATSTGGSAQALTTIQVIRPPLALRATAPRRVVLPNSQVVLEATATVSGGTVTSYTWTQTDGPSTATLTGANSAQANASGLERGAYTFRVVATDNLGGSASQQVTVQVVHGLAVTGLLLTSADLGTDLARLVDGSLVNYQNTPATDLNLRPLTSGGVGSVRYVLHDASAELLQKTINAAPFALLQGEAWPTLPTGDYTVAITPFSAPNLAGQPGQTLIVRFSVLGQAPGRVELGE